MLGAIAEVLPGQDLLAVRRLDGREFLVPFVAVLVPQVNLVERRVVVELPEGLMGDSPQDGADDGDASIATGENGVACASTWSRSSRTIWRR